VSDDDGRPRTPYDDARAAEERARQALPPWLAPPPPDRAALARLKHCWVLADGQRLPALLLRWRQAVDGSEGRVIVPLLVDGEWVPHEVWLPAGQLVEPLRH
jgi:hypothetical protein